MEHQEGCPVCTGTERRLWGTTEGYDIVRCGSCGLGMISPFPSPADLHDSNADIYRVEERGQLYLRRQRFFKRRYFSQLRRLKRYLPAGGRLLDVGCNIGLFLSCAREVGFEVEGIELNPESAAFGREYFNLNIHTVPLEEIDFPAQSFDVITMYDVLEHIRNPHAALDIVHRILKPGGVLIVQSPNLDSLMARLAGSHWCWLTPPDHLYHFTPSTLMRLLSARGFEIVESRTWEPARAFSTNLIASLHERGAIPKIARILLRDLRLVWLPTLLFQRCWWARGLGGLVEVTARKKGDGL